MIFIFPHYLDNYGQYFTLYPLMYQLDPTICYQIPFSILNIKEFFYYEKIKKYLQIKNKHTM